MFDIQNEVIEWGGKKLTIETGRVARQAHGSVIATYGGTSVLATVVADREEKKGLDKSFFSGPDIFGSQPKYWESPTH